MTPPASEVGYRFRKGLVVLVGIPRASAESVSSRGCLPSVPAPAGAATSSPYTCVFTTLDLTAAISTDAADNVAPTVSAMYVVGITNALVQPNKVKVSVVA